MRLDINKRRGVSSIAGLDGGSIVGRVCNQIPTNEEVLNDAAGVEDRIARIRL